MVSIQVGVPVEVNRLTYGIVMQQYGGTCFGRHKDGKYFIKLALKRYKSLIENVINPKL